jgi:hypothetical protein
MVRWAFLKENPSSMMLQNLNLPLALGITEFQLISGITQTTNIRDNRFLETFDRYLTIFNNHSIICAKTILLINIQFFYLFLSKKFSIWNLITVIRKYFLKHRLALIVLSQAYFICFLDWTLAESLYWSFQLSRFLKFIKLLNNFLFS